MVQMSINLVGREQTFSRFGARIDQMTQRHQMNLTSSQESGDNQFGFRASTESFGGAHSTGAHVKADPTLGSAHSRQSPEQAPSPPQDPMGHSTGFSPAKRKKRQDNAADDRDRV